VEGIAASMSVLYGINETVLLSCNKQLVRIDSGNLIVEKIILNELHAHQRQLQVLANKIGNAIPGLRAYVGIDLILTSAGPLVLEINPRLTMSYVGLSGMLKKNLAEIILLSQHIINTDSYKICRYTSQQRLGIDNACA
jgi:predicted ATP-grasp superfamily ATP-dependent carboligase